MSQSTLIGEIWKWMQRVMKYTNYALIIFAMKTVMKKVNSFCIHTLYWMFHQSTS